MRLATQAFLAHEFWREWMRYFLKRKNKGDITELDYDRWGRQVDTPFYKLSKEEQSSDYRVAARVFSMAGINAYPEEIEDKDVLVWRADGVDGMGLLSGSAAVMLHKPTNTLVFCDNHRSYNKNKNDALSKMKRIMDIEDNRDEAYCQPIVREIQPIQDKETPE